MVHHRLLILALLAAACREAPVRHATHSTPVEIPVDAGEPVFALVDEAVTFIGAGRGVRYTWTFGDGAVVDTDGPVATHTYTEPGHRTAWLEVQDASGAVASDAVAVTVTHGLADPAPRAASSLALAPAGVLAVVPDLDALAVVDPDAQVLLRHLDTCAGPRSVAAAAGLVAVACQVDDAIALYDDALAPVVTVPLPWGSRPFGVVVDDDGVVWASLQGTGELARIEDGAVAERIRLAPDLRGLGLVGTRLLTTPHRSLDSGGAWFELDEGAPREHHLPPDPGPDSDTDARGVPTYLQRLAIRPDGRAMVIGGLKANVARGLWRDGQPLTHETTARATVRHVDLPTGRELAPARPDDRDLVSAVAYTPRGDWLFAANLGTGAVDVVDPWTLQRASSFLGVGEGLDGVLVSADGAVLWVLSSLTRELVALDITDVGGPQVERARIDLLGDRPEPLAPEVLLGKRVFHGAGDRRMTASGYISCASCHLDGEDDGRTWDFTDRGEGLRNTVPLGGRAPVGHGPLHWTGNFDEVQDFENDIRTAMGGAGFLADADWEAEPDPLGAPRAGLSPELDALAAYLASLEDVPRSPYRAADGDLTDTAQRGAEVFTALGCEACHPLPDTSDSAWVAPGEPRLHDVGTLTPASGTRRGEPLTGLDTPTLRGLHASAPYLHDGSAPTVRAVLQGSEAHVDLDGVDEEDLASLEAWLLSGE